MLLITQNKAIKQQTANKKAPVAKMIIAVREVCMLPVLFDSVTVYGVAVAAVTLGERIAAKR